MCACLKASHHNTLQPDVATWAQQSKTGSPKLPALQGRWLAISNVWFHIQDWLTKRSLRLQYFWLVWSFQGVTSIKNISNPLASTLSWSNICCLFTSIPCHPRWKQHICFAWHGHGWTLLLFSWASHKMFHYLQILHISPLDICSSRGQPALQRGNVNSHRMILSQQISANFHTPLFIFKNREHIQATRMHHLLHNNQIEQIVTTAQHTGFLSRELTMETNKWMGTRITWLILYH